MMKKIYLLLLIFAMVFLNGCSLKAKNARETVFNIYETHDNIVFNNVTLDDDFYYSGFSSYTSASEDSLKLILLKNNIYSELIIEWQDFINEEVTIELIKIIYYDFENEIYFSIESEEKDGLIYEGFTYDNMVNNLSSIRIVDIQWILENLGYEIR